MVSRPSMARCRRSHVDEGICRSTNAGMSHRSSATTPNPPACATRCAALMARCTTVCVRSGSPRRGRNASTPGDSGMPRTHSTCDSRTPAAAAPAGSPRSTVSIQAATSPRLVADGQRRHEHPRATRGRRPDDLGHVPPRPAATERGIEFGQAGGEHARGRHPARQGAIEPTGLQQRFEMGTRARERHSFLFRLALSVPPRLAVGNVCVGMGAQTQGAKGV